MDTIRPSSPKTVALFLEDLTTNEGFNDETVTATFVYLLNQDTSSLSFKAGMDAFKDRLSKAVRDNTNLSQEDQEYIRNIVKLVATGIIVIS